MSPHLEDTVSGAFFEQEGSRAAWQRQRVISALDDDLVRGRYAIWNSLRDYGLEQTASKVRAAISKATVRAQQAEAALADVKATCAEQAELYHHELEKNVALQVINSRALRIGAASRDEEVAGLQAALAEALECISHFKQGGQP